MEYIKVRVKVNSDANKITRHKDHYEVRLKVAARKGKANLELIKLLNRIFKRKAKIISGLRSKEKLVMLV